MFANRNMAPSYSVPPGGASGQEESVRAAEQAGQFSYPKYLQAVAQLLDLRQPDLPPQMQSEEVR